MNYRNPDHKDVKSSSGKVPFVYKTACKSDIAIHGYWIRAIPAGMTTCVDVYKS